MDLFHIDRYTGDAVEDGESLKVSAIDKIKELKIKAKSRKKRKIEETKSSAGDNDSNQVALSAENELHNCSGQTDKHDDKIFGQLKKKKRSSAKDIEMQESKNNTNLGNDKINQETSIEKDKQSKLTEHIKMASNNKYNPIEHFKAAFKKGSINNDNAVDKKAQHEFTKTENVQDVKTDKDVHVFGSDYNPTAHFKAALRKEIGGFTILGDHVTTATQKVTRKLPDWLSNPHIIKDMASMGEESDNKMKGIDAILIDNLSHMGVTTLFPVQQQLIPVILKDTRFGVGPCVFPPNDICVSAPTGSGKTIAFALPIVQSLLHQAPATRALAVLPTRELAAQVHQVFTALCENTSLRCVLLGGTHGTTEQEENILVKFGRTGLPSLPDIVVATPGRLVLHLKQCKHFVLNQLRFLVIDEADRMMDQIKNDWLSVVETAAYTGRSKLQKLFVKSLSNPTTPLQKLLFSATLSADPEQLEQLNLFQPRLYTVVPNLPCNDVHDTENTKPVGKYTTPVGLTELMVVCSSGEKPLVVLHLALKHNRVLCFAGTNQTARRLSLLVQLYADKADLSEKFVSSEFSSQLSMGKRNAILKDFRAGKINILVASDSMARGMDIKGVDYVILYDAPSLIKTYIHRVGRTARAGVKGTAYTILRPEQVLPFKTMLTSAGKSIKRKKIGDSDLKKLEPTYEAVLPLVAEKLKRKRND